MMALSWHPDQMCFFSHLVVEMSSRQRLKFTASPFDIDLGQLFEDFTQILFHNQIIDLNAASGP